ncbi:MAG: LuxR family transcriptional regulator [Limimaricola sp.]|uniref:helix-turn-helix transcriptional regulator n=1 Tax=Limimaricola sp. TaxID=2211665 RepID=UPI001DB2A861|nr:autoinducer binding domain-containing protein [Limimaricola sp.]MBI1416650.1 LuxR family transcriptional regulator [Limimaricola sp.]
MTGQLGPQDLPILAKAGYYLALRVGFAFPLEEINALPSAWVELYTAERLMLQDPVIRWVYTNTGTIRWSEICDDDPGDVMRKAREFGMRYGLCVAVSDPVDEGQRSFGSFARPDREFMDDEINLLSDFVARTHRAKAPPTNVTLAEIEALRMVKQGKRLKEIAYQLGVSEGAVKQRLKNAKLKLGAKTGAQAAALASQFGLI